MAQVVKSADGVKLAVGTVVAHFMDQWAEASPVLMLEQHPSGVWQVVRKNKYNDISTELADCVYATELGLLKNKAKSLRESAERLREQAQQNDKSASEIEDQVTTLAHPAP